MRQPYQLSIARRYLRARSRNSFISFISLVSMLGIALAVAVLIAVLSVFNGFEAELQRRILGMVSDASLSGLEGPLADWRALRERALLREDVLAAAPFVEGQAMAVVGDRFVGIGVRGIEPQLEPGVSTIDETLVDGSLESLSAGGFSIVLGSALADELEVGVGDDVVLLLAQGRMTPAGFLPRWKSFRVSGLFEAGMYEYDRGLAFVHLDDAAVFFGTGGKAHGLHLAVSDIYSAGRIVNDLAVELGGGFYISDWARQHVTSFRSIQLTKSMFFVILSLVVGVAAFNIVSTLIMVVRDKRGDIAILRSIGASPGSVLTVFAGQGTMIGLIGTAFGVVIGLAIVALLEPGLRFLQARLGIELMSAEAYFISDLPAQAQLPDIVQIAGLALSLAIAATLYPAFSAARQPPAEALRYE